MSSRAPASPNETWGEIGPAMRALPNDRWRTFVWHFVMKPGHGAATQAYRACGLGQSSTPANQAREAHRLCQDDRVIAAISEVTKKVLKVAQPEAVKAAREIIRNPEHPAHGKLVIAMLDRTDPVVTRHDMQVVHRVIDPDQEALEELRAARQLGVTRERLVELFGGNGLARLERLEAADAAQRAAKAKLIDAEVIEAEIIEAQTPLPADEPDPEMIGDEF